MNIHTIDLLHLGHRGRIASYLLEGPQGPVLIETGPHSCHSALVAGLGERGYQPRDVRHVLVTHIHLDHAGAAGWWAKQGARIHVHPVGAPHLVDPTKLIASAGRLYGDRMDLLWGEISPCPQEQVQCLEDDATVDVAGIEIRALATPGHASHHHVYVVGDVAFAGDLAAITIPGTDLVELPTPPPEFDLATWLSSLARLRGLGVEAIYPTHFGRIVRVTEHLDRVGKLLSKATDRVYRSLSGGSSRAEILDDFEAWTRDRLVASGATPEQLDDITDFNPPALSLAGILRYWKKRQGLAPGDAS